MPRSAPSGVELRAQPDIPAVALGMLGAVVCLFVFVTHAGLVRMPYYWDELGQFIPATRDLFLQRLLVPVSAAPNIHPPGVMAWIAGWWAVFGPSIATTRIAMLVAACGAVFASYLLALRLCGRVPGLPAISATLFLVLSPMFYTQSVLAQLDLPATLWTCLTLWLFFDDRHRLAAVSASCLVLTKETGVLLPVVLLVWLIVERRRRDAACYLVPVAVLIAWLVLLKARTGYWAGNPDFTAYNIAYSLNPVRAAFAILRRFYYVFVADFRWLAIPGIVMAWRRGWLNRRRWAIAGSFAVAHLLLVSFLGGAVLDRYLLPMMPVFYALAAIGFMAVSATTRNILRSALCLGLLASLFIKPLLWPFPYEDNIAMVEFIVAQEVGAEWLAAHPLPGQIVTAWPTSAALTRPWAGYVTKALLVRECPDFSESTLQDLKNESFAYFVRFSKQWDPQYNLLALKPFQRFGRKYLGFRPVLSSEEVERALGARLVWQYRAHEQWVEVYARK